MVLVTAAAVAFILQTLVPDGLTDEVTVSLWLVDFDLPLSTLGWFVWLIYAAGIVGAGLIVLGYVMHIRPTKI